MKPKTYNLRAFGWHLYLSRERLRFTPVCNKRGNGLGRRLKELRNARYRKHHGCCELCGQHYDRQAMSLHHVLPFSEFPTLAQKRWNLLMLCPRCHFLLHIDLPRQVQLMESTAQQHGINLTAEFNHAAQQRWNEKQAKWR